ncbi:MAG: metallophosphoesterase [Terracoccus sp.]
MVTRADGPSPTHVIAHLSDPHVLCDGSLLGGRIDTVGQLRQAMHRVEASGEAIDVVVISGDLTAHADPASYRLLLDIVEPVVERLGARLVLTAGNHDERAPLAQAVTGAPSEGPLDTSTTVRGLRIVGMDSAVPGHHHGGFSVDQYDWLATELADPAEHGSVLVMHHPPLRYRSPVMRLLDFDDPARLASILKGTDVRAILCGHLHVTSFGVLAGIPVFVAGAVSYADDAGAPRDELMAVDGPQSWNLVEVHADQVVATVVPVAAHPTWPALSSEVRDFMDAVPADDKREVFSRKPARPARPTGY